MSQSEPIDFRPVDISAMEVDRAAQYLIEHASDLRSSDLFLLTDEQQLSVSIRRLGMLQPLATVPLERGRHLINYLKAMAGIDIAEHRRPGDGRWLHRVRDRIIDMRINCIATLHGEDLAIRLWDREIGLLTLDQLGMTRHEHMTLTSMLTSPSGLILVSGPTGTGKTTTLYASLQYLNNGQRKINTLEDPIEYAIAGIRQSQVHPRIGLDFSDLLRSILRQAPDVIMIGEIRDEETASTAVRAANSGHLVMATLHAPVAAAAVQSLLALGAQPYYLSSCLLGVVAQRLVRTLCPKCRVYYDISEATETFREIQDLLGPDEGQAIYGPSGCSECFQQGYSGRTGLFEILTVNQKIRRLIAASETSEVVQQAAVESGMIEFRRGALLKVAQGVTSTEEILRDVPAEHLGLD